MDPHADASERFMASGLDEADLLADPLDQFRRWYDEVADAGLADPDAMVVATATPEGVPAARFDMLRGVDDRGFRFYTDGESDKAHELATKPRAALVFPWHPLARQVRVTGLARRVATDEADEYFAGRPRGSQLAAAASHQSRVVADRVTLDVRYREVVASFEGRDVPRPDRWAGFVIEPESVEFWQGRPFRFHDRLRYTADPGGGWRVERLEP
jgi:pyridoxamine 5'-phosphate oxidase